MRRAATIVVVLAALVWLSAGAPSAQQTPEQRYGDWAAAGFPSSEFDGRRRALVAELRAGGGGVFLTPAASGASDGFTFRQLDTFLRTSARCPFREFNTSQ